MSQFSYPESLRRDYQPPGPARLEAGDTSLSSPSEDSFEDAQTSSSFHVKKELSSSSSS